MDIPFIDGQKIYLRGITPDDVSGPYVDWLNDFDVVQRLETGFFPVTREEVSDYVRSTIASKNDVFFAIILKKDQNHIGNIKLGGINWIHRYGDLGIMIGDKAYWGKGYGTEACNLLLWYAFCRLNLHKVWLGVHADHVSAIRAYEKVGFKVEGTLRKHAFRKGKYCDNIIMGILQEEYAEGIENT